MNFVLSEDEVKEEHGGAREETRAVVKNKRTTTTTGSVRVCGDEEAEEEGTWRGGREREGYNVSGRGGRTREARRGDGDRADLLASLKELGPST